MASLRVVSGGSSTLRVYLRRSKADEGHQQFSLDVQREGCRRFVVEELARRNVVVSWDARVEYVDDDRAGDDFLGRTVLRRMRNDVQPGDVVLCRDQSRLGRDALEVTLAIRELVRDHGARLPAYACTFHHSRGNSVCPVTIHQPMDDVHAALIDYLKRSVLTPSVLDTVVSAIRDEVAKLLSAGAKDVTGLEKELVGLADRYSRKLQAWRGLARFRE